MMLEIKFKLTHVCYFEGSRCTMYEHVFKIKQYELYLLNISVSQNPWPYAQQTSFNLLILITYLFSLQCKVHQTAASQWRITIKT